jgi:hypothetical protein
MALLVGPFSSLVSASVGYDTQTQAGTTSAQTSLTWNHTCTGTNQVLIVCVITDQTFDPVTTVTYAGVGLSQIGSTQIAYNRTIAMYSLAGPLSGTNAVVVTTSAPTDIAGSGQSFTGCSGVVDSFKSNLITGNNTLHPTTNGNNYLTCGSVCNNGYNSFGSLNLSYQHTNGIGWNTVESNPGSYGYIGSSLAGAGITIAANISAGTLPPKVSGGMLLMGVG